MWLRISCNGRALVDTGLSQMVCNVVSGLLLSTLHHADTKFYVVPKQ